MSVIFMDSFNHYATADLTKKWSSIASGPSIASTSGRRGTKALLMTDADSVTKVLDTSYAGLIVGMAIKFDGAPKNNNKILSFREASTEQVQFTISADGVVRCWRGTSTTGTLLGSSSPNAAPSDAWFFFEASVIFDNAAGAVIVKINGTTVLSLTSVDTQNTTNAYATSVRIDNSNTGDTNYYVNDFYLIDPGTAPNTTFLGDVRVDTYYPTTDGASSQWTPTPSGAHYAVVDETAPNNTDEIEADVTGYIDLFGFQDLAVAPGAFYAVQVCAAALKTDAGSRQVKSVVRRSATNYPGTAKDVSETQKYILNQWNTDPSTAAAWTEAGFNAAEFGVELV